MESYKQSKVYLDCQDRPKTPDFENIQTFEEANKQIETWKDQLADNLIKQSIMETEEEINQDVELKKGIDFETVKNLSSEQELIQYFKTQAKTWYIPVLKQK